MAVQGTSRWFELPAADVLDAMAFYEGLFGWTFVRMEEPAIPDYWMIQQGPELIGGIRRSEKRNEGKANCDAPIPYFTVDRLEPAVQRARELGALPVGGRVDLGRRRGCYQWLRDRQNNLIALWAPE